MGNSEKIKVIENFTNKPFIHDWNGIMTVVDKIESIEVPKDNDEVFDFVSSFFQVNIIGSYCEIKDGLDIFQNMKVYHTSKKESVFQLCYLFSEYFTRK